MKAIKTFSTAAYGFPGHPFPKFQDGFKTLEQARASARTAVRNGWRECEVLTVTQQGDRATRETTETVTA